MHLSHYSVKRPIATIICLLAMIILGLIVYPRIPVNLLPELNYPMAVVLTRYPEAGPEEIEKMISKPVEEAVGTTSGVESIVSRSYEELSMVMVEFAWSRDMDLAALEMRERLEIIKEYLPGNIDPPQVIKADPSLMPIMFVSASRDSLETESIEVTNSEELQIEASGQMSKLRTLEQIVSNQVITRLERIDGVSSVDLSGAEKRQIVVDLNREDMKEAGIDPEQIYRTLSSQNVNYPGGRIVEDDTEMLVRSLSEYQDLNELRSTVVGHSNNPVLLDDVATVEEKYQTDSLVRLNSNSALGLIIQKQSDANTVQVSRKITEELEELEEKFDGLVLIPTWNQGSFIEQVLDMVKQNAVIGGILAALVLFLFLRNVKSTIIVAISIPASVLATFFLAYFSGLSLNIITLSGLALGIGMLVDNSVVVLENIFRHAEQGEHITEAAVIGAQEVSSPIIASTLTTVVVFLPVFLLEDLAGVIFSELSYMVIFSLLISLLIALTIVPVLAVLLLHKGVKKIPEMEKLQNNYQKLIRYCRKKAKLILMMAALITLGTGTLITFMGGEFLPGISRNEFTVDIKLPIGTPLQKTERVVMDVEAYLSQFDEVDTIYTTVGERASNRKGGGYSQRSPHRGELMVILEEGSQEELAEKVERKFHSEEVNVTSSTLEGELEFSSDVEIDIMGSDYDKLLNLSTIAMNKIDDLDEVANVTRNLPSPRPEVQIIPQEKTAGDGADGLENFPVDNLHTPANLRRDLETNLMGREVTVYREHGEEIPVIMGYFTEGLSSISDLRERYGHTAEIKEATSSPVINRMDGERHVTLNVDADSRDIRGTVAQIRTELVDLDLPDDYRLQYGGSYEDMWTSYRELGGALILSFVAVYMVMAAQFESLRYPLLIMISIPFALVGVVLFIFLIGDTLNVASIMGGIILSGLVVNNAIVLLDCIKRTESIEKGAKMRLRPILMTATTTLLALIPMALAGGSGSEIQNSLAFSLMGGLITGTILTLMLLPLLVGVLDEKL